MLMHFKDRRMGIQVCARFYLRDSNSGQNLFKETISCINAD